MNQSSKSLQSELKAVDKALQLNPNNTELLKQKQELLIKSVEETKKKIEVLKEAKDKADKEMENGTAINQDQYRKLQREIITAENNLKDFEKQAQQAGDKFDLLGEKSEKFNKVVQGASLAAAAGVVSIGAAALKTTMGFDSAMSEVAAVSGATGEDLEALREKAKEMGAATKFSASESAEAFNYMAMAGWKTEQMLGGIEGIMHLAAASGEDLATTSDIVTDALTAFGMQAEESSHFADILAAASSNANTNVAMMGETFKYVAPVAGALGYTAEDTALAIGLMGNSGIKSSQAGTQLRQVILGLQGGVELTGQAFGQWQIDVENADGSMKDFNDVIVELRKAFSQMTEAEKAANAEAIAGKVGMSGLLAIVGAGDEDFYKLSDAINNCKGVAAEMAATMGDNLSGDITEIKSKMEGLAISIGEKLMPIARELTAKISEFITWISENSSKVVSGLSAIGAGLVALNVVIMIQNLVKAFKAFKLAQEGATIAQYAMNLAMSLNPIGILIGLITALTTYIIMLYKTNEDFRNKVNAAWESVKQTITEAVSKFITFFADLGASIAEVTGVVIEILREFPQKALEIGKNIVKGLWDGIVSLKDWLSNKVKSFMGGVTSAAEEELDINSPSRVFAQIGEYTVEGFVKGIEDNRDTAVETMQKVIDIAIDSLVKGEKNKENQQKIQAFGNDLMAKYSEGIKNGSTQAVDEFKDAINSLVEEYDTAAKAIEDRQAAMSDKLSSYGALFSTETDEENNVTYAVTNLQDYINTLEKYAKTMEELKRQGIDESLLAEISNMSIDDAIGYGEQLISMSDSQFEEYQKLWVKKQEMSKGIAEDFYKKELDTLSVSFNNELADKLNAIKETTFDVGIDSLQAIINGMMAKEQALYDKARSIADTVSSIMSSALSSMDGADGSHRTGLSSVPFDGYRAVLHKGEMILTQPEADRYKSGQGSNAGSRANNLSVTQNIYSPTPDPRTVEKLAVRELRRLGLGV